MLGRVLIPMFPDASQFGSHCGIFFSSPHTLSRAGQRDEKPLGTLQVSSSSVCISGWEANKFPLQMLMSTETATNVYLEQEDQWFTTATLVWAHFFGITGSRWDHWREQHPSSCTSLLLCHHSTVQGHDSKVLLTDTQRKNICTSLPSPRADRNAWRHHSGISALSEMQSYLGELWANRRCLRWEKKKKTLTS